MQYLWHQNKVEIVVPKKMNVPLALLWVEALSLSFQALFVSSSQPLCPSTSPSPGRASHALLLETAIC